MKFNENLTYLIKFYILIENMCRCILNHDLPVNLKLIKGALSVFHGWKKTINE